MQPKLPQTGSSTFRSHHRETANQGLLPEKKRSGKGHEIVGVHPARQDSITSAISLLTISVSCSRANWEKTRSKVGKDISARSFSIESSATIRPLLKMMTLAQTRSLVAISCELNTTV